jgi:hypothetical protein
VAGCGGGAAELRQCQRKVMTGGAHLSAEHGEGRRRREVRRFPTREAAIGQGATDTRPAGLSVTPQNFKFWNVTKIH